MVDAKSRNGLERDDSALYSYRNGMGAVIGFQFAKDASNVGLHGFFSER
jgi:hypothetical protein